MSNPFAKHAKQLTTGKTLVVAVLLACSGPDTVAPNTTPSPATPGSPSAPSTTANIVVWTDDSIAAPFDVVNIRNGDQVYGTVATVSATAPSCNAPGAVTLSVPTGSVDTVAWVNRSTLESWDVTVTADSSCTPVRIRSAYTKVEVQAINYVPVLGVGDTLLLEGALLDPIRGVQGTSVGVRVHISPASLMRTILQAKGYARAIAISTGKGWLIADAPGREADSAQVTVGPAIVSASLEADIPETPPANRTGPITGLLPNLAQGDTFSLKLFLRDANGRPIIDRTMVWGAQASNGAISTGLSFMPSPTIDSAAGAYTLRVLVTGAGGSSVGASIYMPNGSTIAALPAILTFSGPPRLVPPAGFGIGWVYGTKLPFYVGDSVQIEIAAIDSSLTHPTALPYDTATLVSSNPSVVRLARNGAAYALAGFGSDGFRLFDEVYIVSVGQAQLSVTLGGHTSTVTLTGFERSPPPNGSGGSGNGGGTGGTGGGTSNACRGPSSAPGGYGCVFDVGGVDVYATLSWGPYAGAYVEYALMLITNTTTVTKTITLSSSFGCSVGAVHNVAPYVITLAPGETVDGYSAGAWYAPCDANIPITSAPFTASVSPP